jgi:hypothetical protein
MSAKDFIGGHDRTALGNGGGGGFRNLEHEEKGGQAKATGSAPAPAGSVGGDGMSRFDRLVSNRDFEEEESSTLGGGGDAAACPYGAMGGGGGGESSGISAIQRSDFANGDGGIQHDGSDDDEEGSESDIEIMAPEEAVQVRLSGYLKKFAVGRSGFFKNWKRRFFVCDGGVLAYFENETSKEPLSTIDLAGGAGRRLVTRPTTRTHPEVLDPEIDLVLVFVENGETEERKLLMRADTPDDHIQWAVVLGAFTPLVDHPMDYPVPV